MWDGGGDDDELGSCVPCACQNGYVETGFTQERMDRLVIHDDRLLIAIDNALALLEMEILSDETRKAAVRVLKQFAGTPEEVETARFHFRTDT